MSYYDDVYLAAPEYDAYDDLIVCDNAKCEKVDDRYAEYHGNRSEGHTTCSECGETIQYWCDWD